MTPMLRIVNVAFCRSSFDSFESRALFLSSFRAVGKEEGENEMDLCSDAEEQKKRRNAVTCY
jgi:hypothetical protein